MQWRCNIEGKTDVVVNTPRDARDWMMAQDPPASGSWRRNFDPDRGAPEPDPAPAP